MGTPDLKWDCHSSRTSTTLNLGLIWGLSAKDLIIHSDTLLLLLSLCVCMCVCACVRACVRACLRACLRVIEI